MENKAGKKITAEERKAISQSTKDQILNFASFAPHLAHFAVKNSPGWHQNAGATP